MKKWEEEQRKKAHNKRVVQAKATLSNSIKNSHFILET